MYSILNETNLLFVFQFQNERFIVNGSHEANKLQDLLDGFIRKYVLCPSCDNPETDLIVSAKKGTISQTCRACGFHGPLEVNHKVNTFILKNPPNINPAAQGQSITEGKRKKGKSKNENGVSSDGNTTTGNNSGGDSDGDTSNNHAKETETQIGSLIPAKNSEEDEENWTTDISDAAIRERMKDLTDGAKGMTISDDIEKSEKERLDIFYELVKQKIESGDIDDVATHKELVVEAERLDVMSKSTLVLAELLFTANITAEVKRHRKLLLRFTHNNLKAQRYLIGGIEQIIRLHSKLMEKVAGILKFFYDNDILEEKALLEWSQKVSKKYVSKEIAAEIHEKAKPFIQWLQEAEEEESDEDEEDDSELEIEYDDRARHAVITKGSTKLTSKQNEEADEGDEIDIDDI